MSSVGDRGPESQQSQGISSYCWQSRGIEIATVSLAALSRISRILHSLAGPFVARVSQSGHVKIT